MLPTLDARDQDAWLEERRSMLPTPDGCGQNAWLEDRRSMLTTMDGCGQDASLGHVAPDAPGGPDWPHPRRRGLDDPPHPFRSTSTKYYFSSCGIPYLNVFLLPLNCSRDL